MNCELIYLENQNTNKLIERERSGSETMAGREWFWRVTPKKVEAEDFAQLEISVREQPDDESALVTVSGLIDRLHRP